MFNSLRSRLFASYILLIILSLSVATPALVYLLRGYQNRLITARLDDLAVPLISQMKDLSQQGSSPQDMLAHLSDQAKELGVRILLLRSDGRVIRDTGQVDSLEGNQLPVAVGKIAVNRWQQDRGRYTDAKGRAFIYAAVLVKGGQRDDLSAADGFALVIAQPETGAGRAIGDLFPILLLSAAVAIAVALLVGPLLTRSILRPVGLLTNASEDIGKGNYDRRVSLSSPTEFKQLADTFNGMAYEIGHSRQMLRDFLANVAHEFKTPLTSIRGFVQAQLDGTVADADGRDKALRIVDGEAARLQRLVAELLELARLEARQVSIARDAVSAMELANHCVEIFALQAQEKNATIVVDMPQEMIIRGDFDRLEQVFCNLLDNSLSHLKPGGRIFVTAGPGQQGMVRLCVTDNGAGIDPRDLPHVFERFHTSSDGSHQGTGLGLAIAREIVRSHGGEMTAESTLGNGTVFSFTLPSW